MTETTALDLALAQAKRIQRESRILVQQLARIKETQPTAQEAQGVEGNNSSMEEGA